MGSKKSRTTLNTCRGRPDYETRKTQSLQQVQLGKLKSHMQISKLDHILTPHTKINSWRLKDVNIRHYTTKTPRREHKQNILWHKSRQCFLRSRFQDNRNKSNNNERHIMKLTRICTRKETINKAKSQYTEWDNICKPCIQLRFNMHSIQTGTWSSGQDFTFQHGGCMFDSWLGAKIPHALQPKT